MIGGGGGGEVTPPPPPPPAPTLTIGAQITSLAVTEESGASGARPYSATVYPLRGQVPAGSTIGSTTDSTMRAAILSTWDDGSAAVAVVAGTATVAANGTGTIAVNVATGSVGTSLTTAAIAARLSSVAVDFGPYGAVSLTDFAAPEFTWWATPTTICARYRLQAPTPGSTALEAVIDVHAWADRARVEVVIENGRMNPTTPVKPAAATYTAATVSVNGSVVATAASSGAAEGAHSAFRAWYAEAWVPSAPSLHVMQAHADLQKHPLLFQLASGATASMAGYASDAYVPWSAGRQRPTNMGGTGDHESIGPLTQWDTQLLQTGDYRCARASRASALAVLGMNITHRSSTTGLVPTAAELVGKDNSWTGNWPTTTNGTEAMTWEVAHHPAVGLMAFASRPSPVFIELAQNVAVWNGMRGNAAVQTGVWKYFQTRGRAWGLRSLGHAIFLTPAAHAWRNAAKPWVAGNVSYISNWMTRSPLNHLWDAEWDVPVDDRPAVAGYQTAVWMTHFLVAEAHKLAAARLLSGSDQTALDALADWLALQPVKWINEQTNGGWRYISYETTVADSGSTFGARGTWGAQMAAAISGTPPAVSGTWFTHGASGNPPAAYSDFVSSASAGSGLNYPMIFWSALCAAVERGVSGASTAWATVQANVTGLSTWISGFGSQPRHGAYPRANISAPAIQITGSTWTPNRVAGAGSEVLTTDWAQLPANTSVFVAGTPLDPLIQSPRLFNINLGNSAPGTLTAWVGGAWDVNRQTLILAAGGGHQATAANDNAHFELPLSTLTWTRTLDRTANTDARSWNATTHARENIPDAQVYNVPQEDGRPGCTHTYDQLVWLPPGTPGAGSVKGGLFIGSWSRTVFNLDANTWGAPHWINNDHTAVDWSNGVALLYRGSVYLQVKGSYRLFKFDPSQTETTDWPHATSFGQLTDLGSGPAFSGSKLFIPMPERGEWALLGNLGSNLRFRLGAWVDAGRPAVAGYTNTITLTSSDGSLTDFTTLTNYPDSTGKLFGAGAAYDHVTGAVFIAENPAGGAIYKLTGIATNTWDIQRVVGASTLVASQNGTYGRWRLGRMAGQLVAVRVTTITDLAQVIRLV